MAVLAFCLLGLLAFAALLLVVVVLLLLAACCFEKFPP